MTEPGSCRSRTRTLVALVVAPLFAAIPVPFDARSAPSATTGAFAGAVAGHFNIVVRDVDRAAQVYAELFNVAAPAPREFKPPGEAGYVKFLMLPLAGPPLEMVTPFGGSSPW